MNYLNILRKALVSLSGSDLMINPSSSSVVALMLRDMASGIKPCQCFGFIRVAARHTAIYLNLDLSHI